MSLIHDSFARMEAAAFNVYTLTNLDEWLVKNTFINDKPFNFKDREFQIPILKDTAKTSLTVKCAQVGLSELSYRWAVGACCVMKNFTVIYTFPTATDAEQNNSTRINPMIEGSPEVKRLVSPDLNNNQIKQFGSNSFLYFRGTRSETQALSIPADAVIHDEYDKSDPEKTTVYASRLQDKQTRIRKLFSTPTVPGYGISKEAETAKRYKHLAKCEHCNHWFLPDYFNHVVVPDWTKSIKEITKQNIHTTRFQEAYLQCPNCHKDPNLHHTRMQFVCENDSENHLANAWFVSPFSAHNRITIPYIVQQSTIFRKYSEFMNQTLGLTAEEANESITVKDIEDAQRFQNLVSTDVHQMGVDLGITCHVTIGRLAMDGSLLLVHRERVHYTKVEERCAELRTEFNVSVEVWDSQPYSDIVTRVASSIPSAWGAMFVTTKNPVTYLTQEYEEDEEKARLAMRLVKINRTTAFDELLNLIKAGKLLVQSSEENDLYLKQMTSLKRVQKFNDQNELSYTWVKTGDEDDHYHFSTLYLHIAISMRATASGDGLLQMGIPLLSIVRKPRDVRESMIRLR